MVSINCQSFILSVALEQVYKCCNKCVFHVFFLHIQPSSTEGDTAAPLHPPPVPQSDTEQQEREPVKQTGAEDVLVMDKETEPVGEPQQPDMTPHAKAGTEKRQDEGV